MVAIPGQRRLTDEDRRADADLYRACGLNVSEAARVAGRSRQAMQTRLKEAHAAGHLALDELHPPNPLRAEDYMDARARKVAAFERKKQRGTWLKPSLVPMADEPCILVLMGDPHLDNDGTDFDLFERTWQSMGPGVHGICVGDWFDNWTRALAHLYADTSVTPSEAWTLLSGLMESHGEFLLAACSGNHDDWSHGPVDPVADMMRRYGVRYRKGALRLALAFGNRIVRVSLRHKWRGASMYSAAHGLVRATRDGGGIWDHLMIGGHIHQDENRMAVRAEDGFLAHLCQLSAFKVYDDHADVQGYAANRVRPVRYVVVNPAVADSDPRLVTVFWDFDAATAYRGTL